MKKILIILSLILFFFFFTIKSLPAQGKVEFGFHYGSWSIDILRSMIEEEIGNALETDLKDKFLEDIQAEHPLLEEESYSQEVSFDSGGSNFGFEVRWYPGGYDGSFSLGLSIEKTTMRVSLPEISSSLELSDGSTFQATANGDFLLKPLSFHLHLRWDIKPSWKVRPYLTFGFGIATGTALENAEYSFSYSGDLDIAGEELEHFEGGESKTIKELKDDLEAEGEEFFLPGLLPFIQLNFGIKGELAENFYVLIDAGIWDGLLVRGGLAYRF